MTTHALTSLLHGRGRLLTVFTAIAVNVLFSTSAAWAVSTSGSAYAKQLQPPTTNNPTTRNHSAGPSATSVNSNSRADARGATVDAGHTSPTVDSKTHSISSASATVSGVTVTKTATGNSWVEAGANAKSYSWTAFATGTRLVAAGPDGLVNYQFVIPSLNNSTAIDDFHPAPYQDNPGDPNDVADPASMNHIKQSLFTDDTGLPTQPSFFDVFVDLQVRVQQPGLDDQLFSGSATLTRNNLVPTGDFLGVFGVDVQGNRTTATVLNDVVINGSPVGLQANVPFELTMNLLVRSGDMGTPLDDSIPDGLFGSSGSLISQFRLLTTSHTLQVVPEPSSALLALMSVAGLAAFRRRKR